MFFFLPLELKQSDEKTTIPTANAVLIAICVLIFSLRLEWLVCPPVPFLGIFTYGFCHADIQHLAINMWVLWVFGNPVNRRLGNLLYSMIYLGTLVIVGIAGRIFMGSNLVGASGAIFAIIAIALIFMPSSRLKLGYLAIFPLSLLMGLLKWPEHWIYWFIRWGQFSIRAIWGLAFIPLVELWLFFRNGWSCVNAAHLCGLLCGVAVVAVLHIVLAGRRRSSAPDFA